MKRSKLLVVFTASLTLWGCAAPKTPDRPFKVTEDQFFAKTKIIVLAPLSLPVKVLDEGQVRSNYESLIETRLRNFGYTVVPSSEFSVLWKQMSEKTGGLFDPITGKRDPGKLAMVKEYTCRELAARYNADAILFPVIQVFRINFNSNTVSWHGASEGLTPSGTAFFEFFLGMGRSGAVPALSLIVSLQDMNMIERYSNVAGIQLLNKVTGNRLTGIPITDILTEKDRNDAAVDMALKPMLTQPDPSRDRK
jgi:hypothetical protein